MMEIRKTVSDESVCIAVSGWLDVETSGEFNEFMADVEATPDLVFDFKELEYISSSGIREVIAAYRRQKKAGARFGIINANDEIRDVLSLTGLDKMFPIE